MYIVRAFPVYHYTVSFHSEWCFPFVGLRFLRLSSVQVGTRFVFQAERSFAVMHAKWRELLSSRIFTRSAYCDRSVIYPSAPACDDLCCVFSCRIWLPWQLVEWPTDLQAMARIKRMGSKQACFEPCFRP